jgi:hypothetical protein
MKGARRWGLPAHSADSKSFAVMKQPKAEPPVRISTLSQNVMGDAIRAPDVNIKK